MGDRTPAAPAITVCVPSVRADTLPDTIAAITRQRLTDWELLVVVQGADDAVDAVVRSAAEADERIRGVRVAGRGVSRARNAGIDAARADIVAFTDDDCEPDPGWLEAIVAAFDADGSIGVVAGVLEAPPAPPRGITFCPAVSQRDVTFRPAPADRDLPEGTGFASANLAVRRWVWTDVAPFDEVLGPGAVFPSSEDLDLWIRLAQTGVPVRFTTHALVHHTHGARTGWLAALRMSTAYGAGQGAVAAKLVLTGGGSTWRRAMWEQCVTAPGKSLRLHRVVASLPRLLAFERDYRRCMRRFIVDERRLLRPRPSG